MEKTTSLNIFPSSILPPQPAATRKGDICSFSDMPILCRDHFGRVKTTTEFCAGTEVCNYGSSCMTGNFILYDAVWSLSAWLQAQGEQGPDLHLYLYHPQRCGEFQPVVCLITGNSATLQATITEVSVQRLQHMYILSAHASQPYALRGPQPHQHAQTNHTCTVGSMSGLPSAGLHKPNLLPLIFSL